MAKLENEAEGRYLYCVVNGDAENDFGNMGIQGAHVYTISDRCISAVVHRCPARPYKTADIERAKEWVYAHQYIVDCATNTFGTVIPLTFDTILKGNDTAVEEWLAENNQLLKEMLMELKDRDEYGVQVFLERAALERGVEEYGEIRELRKRIEASTEGLAYLLEKRLKKAVDARERSIVSGYIETLLSQIENLVDGIKTNPRGRGLQQEGMGKEIVLNLSCLVHQDRVGGLGSLLGGINAEEELTVRFTGPWPPYSFVERLERE